MRWWALRTRAIALLLLTAAGIAVFASPVERASNSIGQDLGEWRGEEYRLLLTEEGRTLYRGDRVLFTEETVKTGVRTVVRRNEGDGTETITIFEDGRPIERRTREGSEYYQYDDEGRLAMRTTVVGANIVSVEAFSYRAGQLSAVVTFGSDEQLRTFFSRDAQRIYSYNIKGEGESFAQGSGTGEIVEAWREGEEPVRAVIEAGEDGGYTVTRGDRSEVYDRAARLIQTIDPVAVTNYRYNEERELVAEEMIGGEGEVTITYYEQGRAVSAQQRVDGVLQKTIRYQGDGSRIETLYADGSAYSDVTYEPASNRVRSIVYR